ncbi:MAG: tyrosine-type recombinase/integrase [Anaerocolumna sp.]
MDDIVYIGPLRKQMENFVNYKRSLGYSYHEEADRIKRFDQMIQSNWPKAEYITKEIADAWCRRQPNESVSNQNGRIATVKQFTKYMAGLDNRTFVIRYINKPENQCKQLFKNKFNHSFTREGVTYTLQKYANIAHEEDTSIPRNISPHILRHTKAMHLIQVGVDLVSIRDFLGHVDISTTDIYAKTNVEEKRKALEKAENLVTVEMKSWEEDHDLMEFLNSIR